MASKKDFSTANTGRVYSTITEATAEPEQQEAQEAQQTRKERKTYTEQEQQEFRNDQDSTTKKSRLLLYVPLPLETGCCLTILHTPQEHMGSPLCCQLHHCSRKSSPVTSVLICYFSVFKTQPGAFSQPVSVTYLHSNTKNLGEGISASLWFAPIL